MYLFLIESVRQERSHKATTLLLALYEENQESYDSGKLSNRNLYQRIVKDMSAKGYLFTSTQCHNKIDNLKKKYKEFYDHNSKSGNAPKSFPLYEVFLHL